jgi:hypothetical protein
MIAWRRIGEEEEFAANPTAPKEELLEPPIAEQELDDNRDKSILLSPAGAIQTIRSLVLPQPIRRHQFDQFTIPTAQ